MPRKTHILLNPIHEFSYSIDRQENKCCSSSNINWNHSCFSSCSCCSLSDLLLRFDDFFVLFLLLAFTYKKEFGTNEQREQRKRRLRDMIIRINATTATFVFVTFICLKFNFIRRKNKLNFSFCCFRSRFCFLVTAYSSSEQIFWHVATKQKKKLTDNLVISIGR